MSAELERQAASLLTVGFHGQEVSPELQALLRRGVGGVILFRRNVEGPEQVAHLVAEIKRAAGRPLVVAVDQEGGVVARLRRGFTRVPSMRALGARGDVVLAEKIGRLLGRELRAVGIDVDYAPVLDVDSNPDNPVIGDRSFSRDPHVVARLGIALAQGLEAEGVASCGKHFPGHGDTVQDSHVALPRLAHQMERLDEVELVPFRAAVAANLAALMTAHVVFEAVDPRYPATMSRAVVQGILRQRLGYAGLVVSDDLEMKAIADHYGCVEAARLGLLAGVDSFLCCHTADLAHAIIDLLAREAGAGGEPRERLNQAAQRVEAFVARWGRPPTEPRLEVLQRDEHLACVEEVLGGLEPALTALGDDPTAIMAQVREEREQRERRAGAGGDQRSATEKVSPGSEEGAPAGTGQEGTALRSPRVAVASGPYSQGIVDHHRVEHLAIIGGTHGNELTGAWLLERWRRHVDVVRRPSFQTHVLLGNPKALQQVRRYIDQDLNRSFDRDAVASERADVATRGERNYEYERALALRGQLETFRVIPDGVLVDLHNTTANMGVSLIFVNQSPFNLKLAAWMQKRQPGVRAYCWLDESLPRRSASSVVERGVTIEVGPVANGIVRGDLFWKTEQTVGGVLDFVEEYNAGRVAFDGADEVELFIHERSVDFPRDERERIRGFIHQDLQDRDYLPLEPGAPLFETLDGETLRYDGPPGLCPVFINEAAYYEKKIAFSLTRREVRRI